MDRLKYFIVLLGLLKGFIVCGPHPTNGDLAYDRTMEYLKGSEIPEEYIKDVFNNKDIVLYEKIADKFNFAYEKKPYREYRKIFITQSRISGGKAFYKSHSSIVDSISRQYEIDPFVLVSIVGVESNYGNHHADYSVFNALYSIIHTMPNKRRWASKELGEFLKLCYANKSEPFSIKGSYAGAFGFGQFIPSSFNYYAVDFDGDGIRHHLEWPDVLGSVANYLLKNGYKKGDKNFRKDSSVYRSIYAYNHSDNYVRVILELRSNIMEKVSN